jgi:hypothetical protein
MPRIDISETIRRIDFPPEVWEWLDLFGDILAATEREAMHQEKTFLADTPFKKILLCAINKDLSTLNTIYILLRCELIHQASSHVRLLCESLITLQYISLDSESRYNLFWGYADIEAYEISSYILDWDSSTADPVHVEKLNKFKDSISEKYENAKSRYTFVDKKGRRKPFSNWCNKSIANQARECGPAFLRLYELVYKQMSAYVHGSAWSLRRQVSYSRDHYRPDVVLNDVATIIRTALVVWVEWAKFCVNTLNWRLEKTIILVPKRLNELDAKHFPHAASR